MPEFIDMTGRKCGRWTVVSRYIDSNKKLKCAMWNVVCECGNTSVVEGYHLRYGASQSCGCFNIERSKEALTKFGIRQKGPMRTLYRIWGNMKQRCRNPKNTHYDAYGKRGIDYCERWEDFGNFVFDMGHRPTPLHTLDRVNNCLGYSPENCIWATRKQQSNNRRNSRLYEYRGQTAPLHDVVKMAGDVISCDAARHRIDKLGWDLVVAVETPPMKRQSKPRRGATRDHERQRRREEKEKLYGIHKSDPHQRATGDPNSQGSDQGVED